MQNIINFIKYHNLFTIILGLVLLFTASAFASETVRNTVLGEKIETVDGIDNSQLLAADLENFDMAIQITNAKEDDKNYYIDYTYKTLAIQNNAWQEVLKGENLTISKKALEGEDLGVYLQEELGEVVDYEMKCLRETQAMERGKGATKLVASVDYTGLVGLVLDIKNKVFPEYEPVVEVPEPEGVVTYYVTSTPLVIGSVTEVAPPVSRSDLDGEEIGSPEICVNGANRPCGTEIGVCQIGVEICDHGVWGECIGAVFPTEEICDEVDNDCDGQIDEDGVCGGQTSAGTSAPEPEPEPESELEATSTEPIIEPEPEVTSTSTATSTEPVCEPAEEICDGLDNDCDGEIDEDLIQQCGSSDIGVCQFGTQTCEAGLWEECLGEVEPIEEICDDGIDNNCDGQTDEGCQIVESSTTTDQIATSTSQ